MAVLGERPAEVVLLSDNLVVRGVGKGTVNGCMGGWVFVFVACCLRGIFFVLFFKDLSGLRELRIPHRPPSKLSA